MESTGLYWKSPFAALEAVGIIAWVVNARHVKAVPGRKTDMADAQWLATLARSGLLRASFIPPVEFRQLRLVAPAAEVGGHVQRREEPVAQGAGGRRHSHQRAGHRHPRPECTRHGPWSMVILLLSVRD